MFSLVLFIVAVFAGLLSFLEKRKSNSISGEKNNFNLFAFVFLLISAGISYWSNLDADKKTTSNHSTFFSSYDSRLIVQGLLNGLNTRAHENGWHLWVELPMGVSSDDLNSSLLKE